MEQGFVDGFLEAAVERDEWERIGKEHRSSPVGKTDPVAAPVRGEFQGHLPGEIHGKIEVAVIPLDLGRILGMMKDADSCERIFSLPEISSSESHCIERIELSVYRIGMPVPRVVVAVDPDAIASVL
jgi:hypothetical protein